MLFSYNIIIKYENVSCEILLLSSSLFILLLHFFCKYCALLRFYHRFRPLETMSRAHVHMLLLFYTYKHTYIFNRALCQYSYVSVSNTTKQLPDVLADVLFHLFEIFFLPTFHHTSVIKLTSIGFHKHGNKYT